MNLVLNGQPLTLPDDAAATDVLAKIIEALALPPASDVALSDETGYGVYRRGEPGFLAEWLDGLIARARVAPVRLSGAKLESCMHGSPDIPGQGFLCGRC